MNAPRRRRYAAPLVGLAALSLSGAAMAQTPTPATAITAAPAAAAMPDLSRSIEELDSRLRQIGHSLADPSVLARLDHDTAAVTQRVASRWTATQQLLQQQLRPAALDSLESSWRALRADLDAVTTEIDRRAADRDADLETLAGLRTSWSRTLDVMRGADAPPEVVDRIQGALTSIDTTRATVTQRRAAYLVFQDAIARAVQTCDDALADIGDVRDSALQRVLIQQQPPLWHSVPATSDAAPALGGATSLWDDIRTYAGTYGGGLMLSAVAIVLLMLWLGRVAQRTAGDGAASALRTPYASGLLLGVLLTRPWRPAPPFGLQQLTLGAVTIASVLILRPLVDRRQLRLVYGLAALLLITLTLAVADFRPRSEQVALCAILAAAAACVLSGVTAIRPRDDASARAPRFWRTARTVAAAAGWVLLASALASALGYLDFATFAGIGLVQLLMLAINLLALRLALGEIFTVAFTRRPLILLHAVMHHRAVLQRAIGRLLDLGAICMWIWFALGRFEMLPRVTGAAEAVLDWRLQIGELDLPMARVAGFIAVVLAVVITTRIVSALLEQDVYSRMTLPRGVPYALSTLTRYGLLLLGVLLALATLGLDLTHITVLVSALGLGLGFGMQDVMNNFVSGLIVLFERPVQVGDSIQMGDVSGEIRRIGIRSSTVRTGQGAEVIVPNAKIIAERVTNWTLSDHHRRVELQVSVPSAADAEKIIALLNAVARADERVAPKPPPETLLLTLGDPTEYELRFWTETKDWARVRSAVAVAVQRALRDATA